MGEFKYVMQGSVNPAETVGVSVLPADVGVSAETSVDSQSVVRQATDVEVDAAMEKIFERHDRLFAELAK